MERKQSGQMYAVIITIPNTIKIRRQFDFAARTEPWINQEQVKLFRDADFRRYPLFSYRFIR
jgi:hypothetical protein